MSINQAWFTTDSLRFGVRSLKARFRGARAELNAIRQHMLPGGIACDIGANKGSFLYWLSRWVQNGRVIAFEPQPELARGLVNICRANGLHNVTVEAKAVHSHSGEQILYVPAGHQPGASLMQTEATVDNAAKLTVPVVVLDEYFSDKDRVVLLKIDVEGAEMGVLRGAERILRGQAPLLVFECENRHLAPGKVEDVFRYLGEFGYEGSFVCRNRLLPMSQFDSAVHQRQDGEYFWKSKNYCNNFIFRRVR